MAMLMKLTATVNFSMGAYLLYDAVVRLTTGQQLLIFDEYLGGFARIIPVLLAISMIVASILMLLKRSTAMVFYSYINSFLFLLFYTPSVFYSGIEERYSPWVIVIQFSVLIISTIYLFTTRGKGKSEEQSPKARVKNTLGSVKRFISNEDPPQEASEEDEDNESSEGK